MRHRTIISGIALALVMNVCHGEGLSVDDWSITDTYRESAFVALSIIDWRQTMDIAKHPQTCGANQKCDSELVETSEILGEHPSNAQINAYFSLGITAHVIVALLLPENFRAPWQAAGIVLEGYYVAHNFRVGLSASF